MKKQIDDDQVKQTRVEEQLRENRYETKALQQSAQKLQEELDQMKNVKKQKYQILATLPNGRDACKGYQWLNQNKDKFRGKVYEPLIMNVFVKNAEVNARYLETCVPARDLVAFAAEDVEDCNALMKQFRENMKLRVNVVHVDGKGDPERHRNRSGENGRFDPAKYDFKASG